MAYSKKEREEYNRQRERTSSELGLTKNEYNRLRRTAQALSRADTNYSNGTTGGNPIYRGNKILNRYEDKEHTGDVNKAFAKSRALLKAKKINVYHQSDARGASLYAAKKRIHPDRYPTEGHVIY